MQEAFENQDDENNQGKDSTKPFSYISNSCFNEIQMNVGDGDLEVINGVLPVFDEVDFDLAPFLKSNIFNLLMTFNLVQNVDTLFDNAYQALLVNSIFLLLQKPDSEWKKEILTKTIKTRNSLARKKVIMSIWRPYLKIQEKQW